MALHVEMTRFRIHVSVQSVQAAAILLAVSCQQPFVPDRHCVRGAMFTNQSYARSRALKTCPLQGRHDLTLRVISRATNTTGGAGTAAGSLWVVLWS